MKKLGFVCVALIAAVPLGFLATAFLVVASESRGTVLRLLNDRNATRQLLGIAAFCSLPLTVPASVVGGLIASRLVYGQRIPLSFYVWAKRGCGWGSVLGVLGTLIPAGISAVLSALQGINLDSGVIKQAVMVILLFLFLAPFTGSLAGTIVGLYCARVYRLRSGTMNGEPPNTPLNPTGAQSAPAG